MFDKIITLIIKEQKKQGLNLHDMAKLSGVSVKHICNIKNRKTVPSLEILNKIAEPLGIIIDVRAKKKRTRGSLPPTGTDGK